MQGHIRKRGKTWSYIINLGTVNGKRKQKEKGGFRTKKETQEAMRRAIDELNNIGKILEPSRVLFAEFIEIYEARFIKPNHRQSTYRVYASLKKNYLLPYFGDLRLTMITPEAIQNFLISLGSESTKGYTKSVYIRLNHILSLATEWDYLKANPCEKVSMPKQGYKPAKPDKAKFFTQEEVKKILEAVEGHPLKTFVMIALHTGMRVGEIYGLTWDDVDLANRIIDVNKQVDLKVKKTDRVALPLKSETSYRKINIGNELTDYLEAHRLWQKENQAFYGRHYIESNLVCTLESGEPLSVWPKSRPFALLEEQGIHSTPHMFRHTHASFLIEAGVRLTAIQRRLGHATLSQTLDTYSHLLHENDPSTPELFQKILDK